MPHPKLTPEDVKTRFTYHAPNVEKASRHRRVRKQLEYVAERILEEVPPGREQSLALTKLEEAMMWANAGIAREGK